MMVFSLKIFKKKKYLGLFKFGGEYINQLNLFTKTKKISIDRVFSPPSDLDLSIKVLENDKSKIYLVEKRQLFWKLFFRTVK